jgi:hypothetical protein
VPKRVQFAPSESLPFVDRFAEEGGATKIVPAAALDRAPTPAPASKSGTRSVPAAIRSIRIVLGVSEAPISALRRREFLRLGSPLLALMDVTVPPPGRG